MWQGQISSRSPLRYATGGDAGKTRNVEIQHNLPDNRRTILQRANFRRDTEKTTKNEPQKIEMMTLYNISTLLKHTKLGKLRHPQGLSRIHSPASAESTLCIP